MVKISGLIEIKKIHRPRGRNILNRSIQKESKNQTQANFRGYGESKEDNPEELRCTIFYGRNNLKLRGIK